MGRTESPETSLRTTMGMLVTGSIIRPRIFISTSIVPLLVGAALEFFEAVLVDLRDMEKARRAFRNLIYIVSETVHRGAEVFVPPLHGLRFVSQQFDRLGEGLEPFVNRHLPSLL